jgi:hypothetical protein
MDMRRIAQYRDHAEMDSSAVIDVHHGLLAAFDVFRHRVPSRCF